MHLGFALFSQKNGNRSYGLRVTESQDSAWHILIRSLVALESIYWGVISMIRVNSLMCPFYNGCK
jgi:hypothetical protein